MTLFQEILDRARKMKQYRQQFEQDYDASRRRVDATRKDIDRWVLPQRNLKPLNSKNR